MILIYFQNYCHLKNSELKEILGNKIKESKPNINHFGISFWVRTALAKNVNIDDEDRILTYVCRAHWISSPTP